jgi:hypothetical protein
VRCGCLGVVKKDGSALLLESHTVDLRLGQSQAWLRVGSRLRVKLSR